MEPPCSLLLRPWGALVVYCSICPLLYLFYVCISPGHIYTYIYECAYCIWNFWTLITCCEASLCLTKLSFSLHVIQLLFIYIISFIVMRVSFSYTYIFLFFCTLIFRAFSIMFISFSKFFCALLQSVTMTAHPRARWLTKKNEISSCYYISEPTNCIVWYVQLIFLISGS